MGDMPLAEERLSSLIGNVFHGRKPSQSWSSPPQVFSPVLEAWRRRTSVGSAGSDVSGSTVSDRRSGQGSEPTRSLSANMSGLRLWGGPKKGESPSPEASFAETRTENRPGSVQSPPPFQPA